MGNQSNYTEKENLTVGEESRLTTTVDNAKNITTVLNSVIASAKEIIPLNVATGQPSLVKEHSIENNFTIIVGVFGDLKGRIILDAPNTTVSDLAKQMYGMELQGDMLISFFAELGNMLAGRVCTLTSADGIKIDITPPTMMEGTVAI